MPRPPAKRGRAPRQNASSAAPAAKSTTSKDNATTEVASNAGKNQRRGRANLKQDGPSGLADSTITARTTPVRRCTSRAGTERQSSTNRARGRAGDYTPASKQRPVNLHGSATSIVAGAAHAARGRFSVGPKRNNDASSLIQRMTAGMGTPAFDSSMLSVFRPRPRKGSILQLMADEDGSSDLGDEEDFLGSFEPEDESPPLFLGKRKTLTRDEIAAGGNVDDDGDDEDGMPESPTRRKSGFTVVPSSSSPGNSRKRKLNAVEVPNTQETERRESLRQNRTSLANTHAEDTEVVEETDNAASEDDDSLLPPMPSFEPQISPEKWSQTLALPLSSSPATSPEKSPIQPRSSAKGPKKKDKTAAKAQPVITTATLQANLMPQRRQRRKRPQRRDQFDVFHDNTSERSPSRELEADEDELSYLPSHTRRKTPGMKLRENKTAPNRPSRRSQRTGDKGKSAADKDDPKNGQGQAPTGKSRVTYSRRREQAEDLDVFSTDADTTEGGWQASDELKQQAKKFAEVDQWCMDFEDVVITDEGSQYR